MAHHSRFLMPVVEALKEKGHERLYFTTASDFPFETHAYKLGYPCPLLQYYTNETIKETIKKETNKFFDLWSKKVFTVSALKQWPIASSTNLISCAIKEYYHIQEFFKQEKPDLLIVLQERNRWGKLFGHLCRKHKIPYLTFQEGDYYEDRLSFSAHTEYCHKLLSWGQHTKNMLVRLGCDENKIILTGNTHLQNVLKQEIDKDKIKDELKIDKNKKIVLFTVGIQWGVRYQDRQWENFLYWFKNNPEWQAIVKWHPKVIYNSYQTIGKYMSKKFAGCTFLHNYDIYKLLPIADWVVSLGKTTASVEALCYNKPLITAKGFDNTPDNLYEWKVSQSLEPFRKQNWKMLMSPIPQEIQECSNNFLNNYFYKRNTQAIEIAVEQVEQLINNPYYDPWDKDFDNKFLERIKE